MRQLPVMPSNSPNGHPNMTPPPGLPAVAPLLTPEQAADLLGVTTVELDMQRKTGHAPLYYDIGYGLIRYNTADVNRHTKTRQPRT